jgi:pyruvate formate lyase activating enzyme
VSAPLITGTIFDVKKFAIHDGPGVRTTVFFKGCPLTCALCHNPESQSPDRELVFRADRCRGCGDCVEACPAGALTGTAGARTIDRTRCTRCGTCAEACVAAALEIMGREVTVGDVMTEIEKDVILYDESGGGVTVSGGEPLAQPAFLFALLAACRERAIHTVTDTCGHAPPEIVERAGELTDLFLFDLKLADPDRHRAFTGVSNELILENLRRLSAAARPLILRVPVFPGINDDPDNLVRLADIAASLPHPPPLDLLPYHRGGTEKYARLDRAYAFPALRPPSAARLGELAQRLRNCGLRVTIQGEHEE